MSEKDRGLTFVKYVYIANACGWIASSAAIGLAVWITNSMTPLWFLVIPALSCTTTLRLGAKRDDRDNPEVMDDVRKTQK